MLDILLPRKIKSLLDLIRFNKPTGFSLLMWPCWFGLATLSINQIDLINWYILFFMGSFIMRSAGCIVNDIIDINLDKNIERTNSRPLVTKEISILEAIIFLFILLLLAFLILLQFNTKSIMLGILSLPLVILYPFMKRYTYWPQLFLGIIFSWGVLIVSMQFNNYLSISFIILYIGCIFWTMAYDTIYAYQDREDDIKNNIKSTAVLFGNNGKIFVMIFYTIFLITTGYIGFQKTSLITSIFIIILFLFAMVYFCNKWDIKSKKSSNYFFRINNFFGLLCFIYLLIF